MATSSSYDYSTSATNIIQDALFKIGAAQEGEDIPQEQFSSAMRQLNRLAKFLAAKGGRHLWRRQEVYVFLAGSQARYLLGPGSSDAEWCDVEDFVSTNLDGSHASGATSLTVDSTTNMTANDRIGIAVDDGTRHWTTIASVDSSTTLTLSSGLDDSASDNATVYTYTTRPQRPLRILHARRRDGPSGEDVPIDIEAQELYRDQPLKTTDGTPVFVTYKPTLTSGRLEVWQTPSSVDMFLGLTVEQPFEDFDAGANEPDFPQEWYDPLVYLLAERLEPEYRNLDPVRLQMLSKKAKEMWDWVNSFDHDTGSVYIMPEYYGNAI